MSLGLRYRQISGLDAKPVLPLCISMNQHIILILISSVPRRGLVEKRCYNSQRLGTTRTKFHSLGRNICCVLLADKSSAVLLVSLNLFVNEQKSNERSEQEATAYRIPGPIETQWTRTSREEKM